MPRKDDFVEVAGVRLTSPEKVLYPEQGITKRQLAEYFVAVADWVLPHLTDRPLSIVRCPGGRKKACFYQKHVGAYVPEEVRRVEIPDGVGTASHAEGSSTYLVVDDVASLVALAQMGVLEIHPWGSTMAHLETPDRLIFDLDPADEVPFARVVEAAHDLRERLRGEGLESLVKTTGGKGLHLVIPVEPRRTWDEVTPWARDFAERCVADTPGLYTLQMLKKNRTGRIFLDYLRNGRGATAIAPYSTRAREGATVATPLRWDEVVPALDPRAFTLLSVPRRLARLRQDPWAGIGRMRQTIAPAA
jgi:bifunctional non-homologous end joining protein LigD